MLKTSDIQSMDDFMKGLNRGKKLVKEQNKGRGWEEVKANPILLGYAFKCKDCHAHIEGFVVSPRFYPHCGKEHG